MTPSSLYWKLGCLSAMSSVLLGAFGSHGLRKRPNISPRELEVWDTATRYQFYHSIGLLVTSGTQSTIPGVLFLTGIVLFSGSLYALVLTGNKRLGAITPVGGLAFAAGWAALAMA